MVGCDRVSEVEQAVSAFDVSDRTGFRLEGLEERRVVNVGGAFLPLELFVLRNFQGIPSVSPFGDLLVHRGELLSIQELLSVFGNLHSGRPDVPQHHVFPITVLSYGSSFEIDVHVSGQGVGNHQRRTGQVVSSA